MERFPSLTTSALATGETKGMRRLAFAAAVCGTLALSACSDRESPTEPRAPAPEETFGSSCQVTRFPLLPIIPLVKDVFTTRRLQLEAFARLGAVKLFWDTCHPDPARRTAVRFIQWMNLNFDGDKLPGADAAEVQALTIAVLNGVGVPVEAPTTAGRIGAGIVPANATVETVIPTLDGCLLAAVPPQQPFETNSDQDRLLVIKGLPASFRLFGFPEDRQEEPFWDVDVTLLSGETTPADKKLKAGKKAVVGAVLKPEIEYPDGTGIGHNPPAGIGEPAFEILEEADDRTDLQEKLAGCTTPGENLGFGGFGGGLPGLAQAAWGSTVRHLAPIARSVLLPEPLSATATVLETGPLTKKTRTFSPFGIVEGAEPQNELQFNPPNGDPGGKIFNWDLGLTWQVCSTGCSGPLFPAVLVTGEDGEPAINVNVTATLITLIPVGESREFWEGSTITETTNSFGVATFDELYIDLAGTFRLEFSAPGTISNITSGVFRVSHYTLLFAPDGDPGGQDLDQTLPLSWFCNDSTCWPTVRVEADGEPVGGVEVTVTLVPVGSGSTGSFLEGSTTSVRTEDGLGEARFDNLRVSHSEGGGTYHLRFTAAGGGFLDLTSGRFEVINIQ